jgi:hypothetical protein
VYLPNIASALVGGNFASRLLWQTFLRRFDIRVPPL